MPRSSKRARLKGLYVFLSTDSYPSKCNTDLTPSFNCLSMERHADFGVKQGYRFGLKSLLTYVGLGAVTRVALMARQPRDRPRSRRRALRARQFVSQAIPGIPQEAPGQPRIPDVWQGRPIARLQRGRVRGVPLLRAARGRTAVPLWPWAVLHRVRVLQPRRARLVQSLVGLHHAHLDGCPEQGRGQGSPDHGRWVAEAPEFVVVLATSADPKDRV
ncbi:hypothetical protein ACJZ2D_013987 [Fusarium nematophilum]